MFKKIGLFLLIILIFLLFIFKKNIFISPKVENKINEVKNTVENIQETVVPKPTKILDTGLPN